MFDEGKGISLGGRKGSARERALQTAIARYEGVLTLASGAARPEIARREDLDAAALQQAVSQLSR